MFKILDKKVLTPGVNQFILETPLIAKKCRAGQFVIVRAQEMGERIPLTIADFDRQAGTITIIFQEVGHGTQFMGTLSVGDKLLDVAGPLGQPTHMDNFGTVVCVGGGIGVAPVYPIARAFKEAGNKVISIIGARSKDLLIFEDKMTSVSDQLIITTDDGSAGLKGLVTAPLLEMIEKGTKIDMVMAVGPVIMMRGVAETTRPFQIPTVVSLNPIMVDGTGMCGCCRVHVGDETKFACVDGPDFDAHKVDFQGLMARQKMYINQERREKKQGGNCRCQG